MDKTVYTPFSRILKIKIGASKGLIPLSQPLRGAISHPQFIAEHRTVLPDPTLPSSQKKTAVNACRDTERARRDNGPRWGQFHLLAFTDVENMLCKREAGHDRTSFIQYPDA